MTFRVGQKVVCVDARFDAGDLNGARPNRPALDGIYVVRSLFAEIDSYCEQYPAMHLEEIRNPVADWTIGPRREIGFWIGRFRPVVENKTDIGFAHEILRKASRTRETVA